MKNIQSIAVLITCHNRKSNTLDCLRALYQNDVPKNVILEVFLVDDGSTDGTAQAVREEYSSVHVIPGDGKLFWNRGMYLAWETASKHDVYDFYLWLNDDVKINKSCMVDLLQDSTNNPRSVICGTLKSSLTNSITYGGRNRKGQLIVPTGKCEYCSFINGNVVLIPKIVYEKVGMLDPVFPHAIGDFDYGKRVEIKHFFNLISSKYSGFCEANSLLPVWCRPEEKLTKRIASLYSPLGNSHPYYYFIYTWRHFGWYVSFKHWMSIHLRVLIPSLWKQQ